VAFLAYLASSKNMPKQPKNATFLYYIPLNGFAKNTRWRLNNILKTGPLGHP
jgi:hypothetical protein